CSCGLDCSLRFSIYACCTCLVLHSFPTRRSSDLSTVLVFNYDEWGGIFEHVPPTATPIPPADQAAGNQDGLRGFRVPCVVVSPLARRKQVSGTVFEIGRASCRERVEICVLVRSLKRSRRS